MTEITLLNPLIDLVARVGLPAVVVLLMAYIWWDRKQVFKRDASERAAIISEAKADRLMLTNHLSGMIAEDAKAKEAQAVATTKLADSINNFQTNCVRIQQQLQDEVNRLKVR